MKRFIVYVDDNKGYENFLKMTAANISRFTGGQIEVIPIVGVNIVGAKSLIINEIEFHKSQGAIFEGLILDVADTAANDMFAGIKLLKELRKEPGFGKGVVKILLVTIVGNVAISDVPEADDLISRMEGAGPKEAALQILKDFDLQHHMHRSDG